MRGILKLKPFYSEKIWGYEEWNLSTHRNGGSIVEGTDKTLVEVLGKELPILIKIIQANEALSVQVHPGDEYSRKYENDNGKTECWYILEAKEDAGLICGIKEGLNRDDFAKIIEEGKVEENLKRINVKQGDMIYIPAGTVHAIEGGLKILEIQQSSDVTYRMYDWGRDREMHIEKSLDVIDYEMKNHGGKIDNFTKLETPYFTVDKIIVDGSYEDNVTQEFHSYTVISGEGTITSKEGSIALKTEETVYITKDVTYKIEGKLELLKSYV
ncbi:type I phosphomannose isomerase catalytic subunit [Romboutsia sp.]|uniref:type I phosphomannose isomerase catalytic subunit n=1 Tax=Romboutsia sp. TaxID=1965302 RepID=UPI003F41626C